MTLRSLLKSNNQTLIETTLQERFSSNLSFFASLNPKLYEKLLLPPKNYNLYFDSKGINIINLSNHSFVYPKENDIHAFIQTHDELCKSPLKNPKWKLSHNQIYLQKMDTNTFPITGEAINTFIDNLDKRGGVAQFHLPQKFLPNTCIFGALGGLMIAFLLEEGFCFHSLLWFEEEIDFFRIACFFVDFPLLFERCASTSCYLFIQDLISREIIRQYFETHKITNNFLRLELSLYSSEKIENAQHIIYELNAQNARGWGSFEDECIGLKHTLCNLSYPTLTTPKRLDIPICVVGNGSSLDSLLPFIQSNQDKMIIFSCGTALKVLKNYGIFPDFQIEIERIGYLKDVLLQAPLRDTPLICGNMVNPSAIALANEAFLFMRGGNSSAYLMPSTFVLELSSPFVGNAGVALACALGSDVILCGLDCGYIEGQSKHAKGSFYGKEQVKIPNDAFEVKANGDKKVYSTSIYSLSASMMSLAISYFKPNVVLNLGNGAYIHNAKSVQSQDFTLKAKDKTKAIAELKACFQPLSSFISHQDFCLQTQEFLKQLKSYFSTSIHTKQELFTLIDLINHFCFAQSASNPSIGVLFEGSIYHLLQNLMMCALHYPHNDITLLYQDNVEVIKIALDKMQVKLRLILA